jgi:hypothetical protein
MTYILERPAKTCRFSVGQKLVVLNYVLNGRTSMFSNPVYRPWSDKLDEIKISTLTVDSQHDVPSSFDPSGPKDYVGFLLKDTAGQIWSNQYPHASYGQVSDAADWLFHRVLPNYDQASDEQLSVYEDASQVLDRIQRGIAHFSTPCQNLDLSLAEQLKTHLADLTAQIHAKTGASVRYVPIWNDHPDITRAEFFWS